jgi:WD40 repeat protein
MGVGLMGLFQSLFSSAVPTIDCKQQPRWSQRFLTLLKQPDWPEIVGPRRQLYVRDYQDRTIALDAFFQQGEAAVPLLIEALRDPYGGVRSRAESYLEQFTHPMAQQVLQVTRYRQVKCIKTIKKHNSGITSVAISPNDQTLLTTAGESAMYLWDIATGDLLQTFSAPDAGISNGIFNTDGRYIFSNHRNAEIWVWDRSTAQVVQKFQGHTDRIAAFTLASTGNNLISASWDKTICVWDLTTGKLLNRLAGHTDRVQSVALSNDGETIFSGGADGTIRYWERRSGKVLRVYQLGKTIVHALATHPLQPILFSGDQQVRLSSWDYQRGEHLDTLPSWTYRPIHAIAPSPDGEVVLQTCGHGINVWHQPTGWFVHTLVHHRWAVTALAISGNGQWIVSGSDDKTVKIWGWRS